MILGLKACQNNVIKARSGRSGFCLYKAAAFFWKNSLNFLLVSIFSIRRKMVCLSSASSCCMSLICSTTVLSSKTTSFGTPPSWLRIWSAVMLNSCAIFCSSSMVNALDPFSLPLVRVRHETGPESVLTMILLIK